MNDQVASDADAKTDKKDDKKDDKVDDDKKPSKADAKDAKDKKAAGGDYQLSRALDLIRAVSIYQRSQGDNGAATPATTDPVPAATPTAAPAPIAPSATPKKKK